MSWLTDLTDAAALRDRTEKTLNLPLGFANPVYLALGAAAGAGAAWWLMTRWTRAVNLEALSGAAPAADLSAEAPPARIGAPAELLMDAPTSIVPEPDPAPAPLLTAGPAEPLIATAAEATPEACASAPEPATAAEPDDLTRINGVGPKTAAALAEQGVTRFADLAAWTPDEMAAFDAAHKLKGRSAREAWLAQARRFAGQG